MKKTIRAAALLTAALLLLSTLLACTTSPAVLTYGKSVITEREYRYYLATYKAKFMRTYSNFEDDESFYSTITGGMTVGDYFNRSVRQNVSMTLVCDGLFNELGLKLDKSAISEVDDRMNELTKGYANTSIGSLNKALEEYGINRSELRTILLRDKRMLAVYDYYYGEEGVTPVTEDQMTDYLERNYVRIAHIYVNDQYVYELDANGEVAYNLSGYPKTIALTEEEKAAKRAVADEIETRLEAGEEFDTVYEDLSEEKLYKNGYYISEKTFDSEIVQASREVGMGEWIRYENDTGIHFIKRLPMSEKPWEEAENADFFRNYATLVGEELFKMMLNEEVKKVVADEELLAAHRIEDSPVNYQIS